MKVLFLNPDFEASTYDSSSYDGENAKNLTWEDIMKNMSSISLRFFGRPVSNQLGKEKESIAFPHMAKRYVFTRILIGVKKYPEMATFATAFGGVFGFSVSEFYKGKRHAEIYTETKRANDLKEVELGIKSEKEYRVAYGTGEPNQKDQTQNLPSSSQAKPSIKEKSEAVNVSCSLEEKLSSTILKYLRLDWFF